MTALIRKLRGRLEQSGHGALAARVFGSGFAAVLVKIAAAGLGYLMFVIMAKLMPPNEYGKFAFGFNLAIVASTVAGVGATTAILRFWPEYDVKGQSALAQGALRAGAAWTAIASVVVGLLVIILAPAIAKASGMGNAAHIMMVGLLGPAMAFSEFASAALRAKGITLWALAPRDVIWRAGLPVVAALIAWNSGMIDAATGLFAAAGLLLSITALQGLYALRQFGTAASPQYDLPLWRRATVPMWGSAILFALVQQFDVVIAAMYLPAAETGAYFAAQKTASLLTLFLIAGNLVGAPMISSHYHANDKPGLQRLCGYLSIGIAAPTVLGFLFLVVLGGGLLGLFGASFALAYPILLILAAAATFDSLAGPTAYFLQMSGRESTYLKIMALTYAGVLVLQFLLAPIWGAAGIAIPTALGVIVWNVAAVVILRRQTGVDPSIFGLSNYFRRQAP
jgi:O-antigen/teichoic acid export membrane protein